MQVFQVVFFNIKIVESCSLVFIYILVVKYHGAAIVSQVAYSLKLSLAYSESWNPKSIEYKMSFSKTFIIHF